MSITNACIFTVKKKKCGAQIAHRRCGGLEGIRTLDFYNANVALSQLSYEPLYGANAPITSFSILLIKCFVNQAETPTERAEPTFFIALICLAGRLFLHLLAVYFSTEIILPPATTKSLAYTAASCPRVTER